MTDGTGLTDRTTGSPAGRDAVPPAVGHRPRLQRADHRGRGDPAHPRRGAPGRRRGHRGRRRLLGRDRQGAGRPGDSTVRVINHQVNQGKGAAIRTGLAAVRGDLVLIQDADLEYDPADWPKLLEPDPAGQGPGRLRQPLHRRAQEHVAAPLDRQPLPLPGHQHPLLVDPLGHGDLLQALRPPGPRGDHHRVGPVRLRAGDHRQGPASRATGSTRSRSPTPAGRSSEGKKITWRDGFGALGPWSSTASPGSIRDRRRRRRGGPGPTERARTAGPAVTGRWRRAGRRGGRQLRRRAPPWPPVSTDLARPGLAEVVVVDNGSADGSVDRAGPPSRTGGRRARGQSRVRRGGQPGRGRHQPRRWSWCATPTWRSGPGPWPPWPPPSPTTRVGPRRAR